MIAWTLTTSEIFLLSSQVPGLHGWLHEEGHRSVLGRHGINSINEINQFTKERFEREQLRVYGIQDEDLIALKKNHPADMVRLHIAGDEMYDPLDRADR